MGGRSAEREVSLVTGRQVVAALSERGYRVVALDTREDFIRSLRKDPPDVAFIALHGRLGEDGTMQGLLEILQIPYTGSGVLASAMAMDKVISKSIFVQAGIPTPPFVVVDSTDALDEDVTLISLGLPVVVKPACEGSAIGVSIVREKGELLEAITGALKHGGRVLLEQYVRGVEVTVGVIEDDELRPLPTLEIVPANEMYDYEAKYTPGMSEHIIPARICEGDRRACEHLAIRAHRALCCFGFSRTDLIVTEEGPSVLEVNTIPGMTGTSLFPEAAKAVGIEFGDLVERLVMQPLTVRKTAS
ncbi:MAG: D-alanine--D-alanine ligase [Actinobacteria bacterium]|nr:MAG: D-alanine--D-alanine ligase [Actinomycetota bacterium]